MKTTFLKLFIATSFSLLLTVQNINGQARVGFSTIGEMINIPSTSHIIGPDFLRFGFGVELNNFSPFQSSQGIYFDFEPSSKYRFGITALKGFKPESTLVAPIPIDPPPEFGFSFQRNIFTYENMSVAAGVMNIIFTESKDTSDQQILSSEIGAFAFYGMVTRVQEFELYRLKWSIGIGTGTNRFAADVTAGATTTAIGIFAGFDLRTTILPQIGGLRILGEYDGRGMNIGTKLPLTRDYTVNFAIIQIEKILKFGQTSGTEFPGISMGVTINFPRRIPEEIIERPIGLPYAERITLPPGVTGEPGFLVPSGYMSEEEIQDLRDSLNFAAQQIETLDDLAMMLRQRVSVLQDSVQIVKTERFALEQNINAALKHLSRSLRYFYATQYRSALEEVETAIEFNPNLALAYARRGSIFYKLGDTERAVMNWNVALQLDPEYEDIRNILRAMGENRLRVTSFRR